MMGLDTGGAAGRLYFSPSRCVGTEIMTTGEGSGTHTHTRANQPWHKLRLQSEWSQLADLKDCSY